MKNKICTKCKKEKDLSEFYKHKNYKDGHCACCIKCYAQYHKSKINREKQRESRLKRRFNLTLEQYDQMFEEQKGTCVVCKSPETRIAWGTVVRLSIDHDHKTEKVRALFCDRCNRALGAVNDNVDLLQKLIGYLRRLK